MPRNPLLGLETDEEVKNDAATDESEEVSDEEAADASEESEDEESEEETDGEEESEEEAEEAEEAPVAAPKKRVAARQPQAASARKKGSKLKVPGTGTLGDARVDKSVPLSANARIYLDLLLESPLTAAIIPPDILNEDTEHVFCINSLRIIVPKGRIVQVPYMLALEINQAFKNRI